MMRNKEFSYVSYLIVLALTAMTFTACSSDIEELLSEETTPIDFEFENYDDINKYVLFDYAGNRYVGSDTITRNKCTLNLRQGKHHLLWMKIKSGHIYRIGFNPESKMFDVVGQGGSFYIEYSEMDLEVTPYLMPVRKVVFDKSNRIMSCCLAIDATDIIDTYQTDRSIYLFLQTGNILNIKYVSSVSYMNITGFTVPYMKITGIPLVKTVSLDGKNYTLENDAEGVNSSGRLYAICPTDGFNKVQVRVEMWDVDDNPIPVTQLPKFNLRPGYITTLRGPLFSGSTDEWTVTMEPFAN